jgi:hypothetical protein
MKKGTPDGVPFFSFYDACAAGAYIRSHFRISTSL